MYNKVRTLYPRRQLIIVYLQLKTPLLIFKLKTETRHDMCNFTQIFRSNHVTTKEINMIADKNHRSDKRKTQFIKLQITKKKKKKLCAPVQHQQIVKMQIGCTTTSTICLRNLHNNFLFHLSGR